MASSSTSTSEIKKDSKESSSSDVESVRPNIVGPALVANSKEFLDVKITLFDGVVYSHRIIVAAASPLLADLIRKAPPEAITNIEWRNAKFGAAKFNQVMTSIYDGRSIPMTASEAPEWLEFGRVLDCAPIRFDAVKALTAGLTVENAVGILNECAGAAGTESLMEWVAPNIRKLIASAEWVKLNPSALGWILSSNELYIPEVDLVKAAVKWAFAKLPSSPGQSLGGILAPFIGSLRLPLLSVAELATVVVPLNVLDPPDQLALFQYQGAPDKSLTTVGRFSARLRKVKPKSLTYQCKTISDGGNETIGKASWIFDIENGNVFTGNNHAHKMQFGRECANVTGNDRVMIGFVDWRGYAHCPIQGKYDPDERVITWIEDFKSCNGTQNSTNTITFTLPHDIKNLQEYLWSRDNEDAPNFRGRYVGDGGWSGEVFLSHVIPEDI